MSKQRHNTDEQIQTQWVGAERGLGQHPVSNDPCGYSPSSTSCGSMCSFELELERLFFPRYHNSIVLFIQSFRYDITWEIVSLGPLEV